MSAAIAFTPASPFAKKDATRFDVTGASTNRADHSEFRYYITMEVGGKEVGRSYVFNVSHDGKHQFFTYIFPSSGAYSVVLRDVVGDGAVATESVTVQ